MSRMKEKWRARFSAYYDEDIAEEGKTDEADEINLVPHIPEEPITICGRELNAVLGEMYLALLAYGIALQFSVVWFLEDKWAYSLGLWLGIIVAAAYIAHMWWSIEQCLYMMKKQAAARARLHTLSRFLVVAAVLIMATYVDYLQLLAVFIGIMGVKVAALLQPQVRKIRRKMHNQERV